MHEGSFRGQKRVFHVQALEIRTLTCNFIRALGTGVQSLASKYMFLTREHLSPASKLIGHLKENKEVTDTLTMSFQGRWVAATSNPNFPIAFKSRNLETRV